MEKIFKYTFNTVSDDDGVYLSNDKKLPKMYNFGTWAYMDEVSYEYGEGGCVLWRTKLATAVTTYKDFIKDNIDTKSDYTLTIRLKVIKPLNDTISVGFFRSSGDFNVLNDGPLKGAGPFTKIGSANKINEKSIIKAVDINCDSITDEFFEVNVTVNGGYIRYCMEDNHGNDPVYVGIMNFAHRNEPDGKYIAISEITIEKANANISFEGIEFYETPEISDNISLLVKHCHAAIGETVSCDNTKYKITNFSLALCNTMELQTKIIYNNSGSSVVIKGFKKSHIYDDISFSSVIIGVTDDGHQKAWFGETITFSLAELYKRNIKNNKKINHKIKEWFKPVSRAKINLFNDTPVNSEFLGFGALYYPWIYLKDKDGRNYTEEEAKTELDRLGISGVRIARATLFVSSNWYNEEQNSWNFDDEEFNGLLKSFLGMSQRNIDIMLNFEWGNSINFGPVFANENLAKYTFDKQCEIFGTFVRDFVTALKNNGVKTLKYLTFFSEPANGITGGFESDAGKALVVRYEKCISAVHNALCDAGIRKEYKMVLGNVALATEIWNYTWQYFEPIYNVLKPFADDWSYHNYNRYSMPYDNTALPYENMMAYAEYDIRQKTGVKANEVWIDEYNALDRNNTWFEFRNSTKWNPIHIIAGMVANINIGFKTILNWTFINTLWIDSHANQKDNWLDGHHCWGLIPHPHQDKRPYNSFYAYQIVASHITAGKTYRGDNIIECGLCCCACENNDGSYTVIVVNSSVFDSPFELKLSKALDNLTFKRYLFDSSKNYRREDNKTILPDKNLKNVTNIIKDTLPSGSVAVYTTMT